MDDDQFQGGLSVQGGNPDPNAAPAADMSYDTNAGEGNADLPPLDFEESTPAPAPEPEHEIDPEMSRKMDEALGGFDMTPMTPSVETPVLDAEPVQQPTDFSSPVEEAPVPMTPAAEEPVAPVEPVASVEAPVPPVAPVAPVEAPVAPVEAPVVPAEQPFAAPTAGAGVTMADYASTPQSAAQSPMQPMTTAPAKKGPNKIVIIALAGILVVGIIVAVIVLMNQPKKNSGKQEPSSSNVVPPEEDEPEVETKQIGSEVHGYLDVPEDWVDNSEASAVLYKSKDGKISIRMDSATIAQVTAAAFANSQLTKAQSSGASQPQMTTGATKKVGEFNSYEVNYYVEETQTWNFKYIFEASDNRTHYIWVQCDEPGDETVATILKTFTLVKTPVETPVQTPEEGDTENEVEPVE